MNSFAWYIVDRFFFRIFEFLRNWYLRSGRKYGNFVINVFEQMDRVFGWKVNILHMFSPLYRDYSVLGYILGFVLRLARLVVTSLLYAVVFLVAVFGFITWMLIPIYIVWNIFT
jgi:hypothetical protein